MVNYAQNDPPEQFHLLLNDGNGYLDLFAASHFYFNTDVVEGIPRFVERRADLGLPLRYDEGLKFLDYENDGRLDLLLHHPSEGPQVWRFDGTRFSTIAMPIDVYLASYGANVYDMNGGPSEHIVLAPGCCTSRTRVLLNTGRGFVENPLTTLDDISSGVLSFAGFDRDRRIDIDRRSVWSLGYAMNVTPMDGLSTNTLDIVDAQGGHTQFGRVVRVRPRQAPDVIYTRVVDGGSSLMVLNQYPILIGMPYDGDFEVTVRFADGGRVWVVTACERLRLFADGRKTAF
jgi:hypothetical protein